MAMAQKENPNGDHRWMGLFSFYCTNRVLNVFKIPCFDPLAKTRFRRFAAAFRRCVSRPFPATPGSRRGRGAAWPAKRPSQAAGVGGD